MKKILFVASVIALAGIFVSCNRNNPDIPDDSTGILVFADKVLDQSQEDATALMKNNGFTQDSLRQQKFLKGDTTVTLYYHDGKVHSFELRLQLKDMNLALTNYRNWSAYAWKNYFKNMPKWSGLISSEVFDKEYSEEKGKTAEKNGRKEFEADLEAVTFPVGIEEWTSATTDDIPDVNAGLALMVCKTEHLQIDLYYEIHKVTMLD